MNGARLGFVVLTFVLAASCGSTATDDDGDAPLPDRNYADGGKGGEAGPDGSTNPNLDGGIPTGPDADAQPPPPPPPPCDLGKPFGTPVAITELNSNKDDIVSDVSDDELTMYVSTNNGTPAGVQSFVSKRGSKNDPWGAPQPLFPSGSWDNWAVTVSGNTAIVSSDRSGNSELYIATRPDANSDFGALTITTGPNSGAAEEGPRLIGNSNTFYFDSTRNGSRDIFSATMNGGTFTNVAPLPDINTGGFDGVPVLLPDELTMYFGSDRPPATGGGDIFVATRASKNDSFGNVTQVPNINSSGLEAPGHVSPDNCTIYFSSTRLGTFDIYVAKRPN